MIYLTVIFLIIIGIFRFDFSKKKKSRWTLYYIIVTYLIVISGLAYHMGDDGMLYEYRYNLYGNVSSLSLRYFTNHRYMPGWVFLSTLCKTLSSSYTLFKMVHALIVNYAISDFIKKNISLPYTGLLFYFILLFFDMNFGILRQSLSIAFFLFSLRFFNKGNWIKYYVFCILAFLFHESAIICFFLPLLNTIKISHKMIFVSAIVSILIMYFASAILSSILSYSFGDVDRMSRLEIYAERADTDVSFSIPNLIFNMIIPMLLLLEISKTVNKKHFPFFVLCYVFVYLFAMFIPIVFRFNLYFVPFYIMLWVETVSYYMKRTKTITAYKGLICLVFCFSFLFFKKRTWFSPIQGTSLPHYIYIYPYTSIITEEIVPEREAMFRINVD